jgi:hypothetical protein
LAFAEPHPPAAAVNAGGISQGIGAMAQTEQRAASNAAQQTPETLAQLKAYLRAHRPTIEKIIERRLPYFPVRLTWNEKKKKIDKKPMIKRWQSEPPRTEAEIRAAFAGNGWDVAGMPTGAISGIDALDVDPRHGGDQWSETNRTRTPPTRTHVTQSGGFHLLYKHTAGVQNSQGVIAPGVDVRGDGGYIVDWSLSGFAVQNPDLCAPWPEWIRKEMNNKKQAPNSGVTGVANSGVGIDGQALFQEGQDYSYLHAERGRTTVDATATTQGAPPNWNEEEENRVRSALGLIPAKDRQIWLITGMALHWTRWGDRAFKVWDDWSRTCPEKYDENDQQKAWVSFDRPRPSGRNPITLGTLFDQAKGYGWKEPPQSEIAELNKRFFLIRNIGGKCLVGEMVRNAIGSGQTLSLQSTDAFKTWCANRKIRTRDKDRNQKWKPLGTAWLEHAQRRQYEGVDLVPNAPTELPNGNLNLWRGFGVQARPGKWSLMLWHICNLLGNGDPKAAEYIVRWTTWGLQHPGELPEVALG